KQDVVTKSRKTHHVLQVMPGKSTQRAAHDVAEHDDPKPIGEAYRWHAQAQFVALPASSIRRLRTSRESKYAAAISRAAREWRSQAPSTSRIASAASSIVKNGT